MVVYNLHSAEWYNIYFDLTALRCTHSNVPQHNLFTSNGPFRSLELTAEQLYFDLPFVPHYYRPCQVRVVVRYKAIKVGWWK